MAGIEDRKFQRIDDASYGVDDTSGQKPSECCRRKGFYNFCEGQHTNPAHSDINNGREPFGACDPAGHDDDAYDGDSPDEGQHIPAGFISENDNADGGIGSGDQDEDHHVVDLSKHFVDCGGDIQRMIDGAGRIEQDHAADEYDHGYNTDSVVRLIGL